MVLPNIFSAIHASLSSIVVSEEEVANLIFRVDITKACGMDGISNKMIKLCNYGIHGTLTSLINTSLSLGQFPHLWTSL